MKIFFVFLLLFFSATFLNAQWIINGFETVARDSFFLHPPINPGLGTGTGGVILTDNTSNPAPFHGNAALKCVWTVHSTESWGGFIQMMHLTPTQDATYMDFSSGTHLRIRYYTQTPSSKPGLVNMRFKLHEAGGTSNYWANQDDHEDWYFEKAGIYDAAPGWNELLIPLVDRGAGGGPNDEGFSLPGWSGQMNNGELDLDKIVGYSIEWTTPGIPSQGTASGVVLWDKLELIGFRYAPLTTFDSTAVNNFFVKDLMGWDPGNQGYLDFTDVTVSPFEGYSSLKVDWQVHMSQSWGGYVNFTRNLSAGTFLPDLTVRTHLLVALKVQTAASVAGRVTLRCMLFDASEGANEQWYHQVNINVDTTSDWQMIKIPLVSKMGGDPWTLPTDGFIIPGWESYTGNGLLDLNKITGFKFEFSGNPNGPQGITSKGTVLFDLLIPTGIRETDNTPPDKVTGFQVVSGTFTNLITWIDVPGESGERYDIYYSKNPITDLNWAEVVKLRVTEGVQIFEHLLRAPNTNQSVRYYYAITCTDKAGNVSLPTILTSPITNTAKGVRTISLTPPTNFKADGDLSEWSGVQPIRMYLSEGNAYVVTNTKISGDADLAVKAYVAMDNSNMYIAFDVEDDIVSFNPSLSSYLNDAPDIFIGLYNWHGKPHTSYKRGAQPDYHIRFAKDRAMIDGLTGGDSLLVPGTNYFWGEKFPTGYVVEAKIPFSSLAQRGGDNLFSPLEGMRLPLDFSINDADATGSREGIMTYSPYNEDQSWNDVSRWLYTWIGNLWDPVGVEDDITNVYTYNLSQNYPNPFNPKTTIAYSIEKPGNVSIKVFDVLGRQISGLVNEYQNPGKYSVDFNASKLSSGIYFYSIDSGSFRSIKKMMFLK